MRAPLNTLHVAVLMGGLSSEREVSLSSGRGCADALEGQVAKVTRVDAGRDLAQVLTALKPDVVFNALHGECGEDGCVQGILETLRIPYNHSAILHYCHELGVQLEPFMQLNYNAYVHSTEAFGGKPQRYRNVQADYFGHVAELMAKAANKSALDDAVDKETKEILLASLRSCISAPEPMLTAIASQVCTLPLLHGGLHMPFLADT